MFSLLLHIKRSVKRLLKVQSESRQRPTRTRRSRALKLLMLLVFSTVIGIFYPGESLFDPFDVPRRGEVALEDIIAPFTITVLKTERELEDERDDARLTVPFVVDYDSTAEAAAYEQLNGFLAMADSLGGGAVVDSLGFDTTESVVREVDVERISSTYPMLSRSAIEQSLRRSDLKEVGEILSGIYRSQIYKIGVLPQKNSLPESRNKHVLMRRGERETIHLREKLLYVELANVKLLSALNALYATDSIDVEYYYLVGRSFIQPNLRVNSAERKRRLREELDQISAVKEVVEKNDIIVRAGMRIQERQERILREMVRLQRGESAGKGWLATTAPAISRTLLVIAAFFTLYLFLYFFRREVYYSNPKILTIFLVFIIELALIYAVDHWALSYYLYPVAFLPMMITILFDAELSVLATIVMAVVLGIMQRFDFTIALMTIVVGIVVSFTSHQVRRRSQFFRIMLFTSMSYVIFILLVETMKLTATEDLLNDMGFGLVNGLLTVLLAIGLLPVFESLFGITTDITLLELSDLNHPLLKRLALEAPGTYHHSIIVGNLSEAAAEAIGGNSLLARVGAYYHDIGKMEIPEYFVENQLSVKSKHDSLTPTMSSLVLSSHVKNGRILGELADIPDDVLNFIEEHHGTMVQKYFYDRAQKQGDENISMDKFRYPGPKPQTRETGIAMLADAVEAASRTLDQPTPARIDNLIQRIINDRFQSGELNECPLTLRDLAGIKRAFAQVLIASFHHRVKYPKSPEEEDD